MVWGGLEWFGSGLEVNLEWFGMVWGGLGWFGVVWTGLEVVWR